MDPTGMPQQTGQVTYPPQINHYQGQIPPPQQGYNVGAQGLGAFSPQYGVGGPIPLQQQMAPMGVPQNNLSSTSYGGLPTNSMTPGAPNAGAALSGAPMVSNQAASETAPAPFPPFYGPQLNPATAQFFSVYEPPPPVSAPPTDPEEAKRIDKVAEYAAKNGQQFEALMREKQKGNPAYAFLVGGENSGYYRYKLWSLLNPHIPPEQMHLVYLQPAPQQAGFAYGGAPPEAAFAGQPPFAQFPPPAAAPPAPSLPTDVSSELADVLEKLTGTKESIKGTKAWFMERVGVHLTGMVGALRDRVLNLEEVDKQLHVIYLVNDILFSCLSQRTTPSELDAISLDFSPVLGQMLAAAYNNATATETNKERLTKILHFWGSKDVFDSTTIAALEKEMQAGLPANPPISTPPHAPVPIPPQTYAHSPSPYVPPTSWTPPPQQYPMIPPQQDPYLFGGHPMPATQPPPQFAPRSTGFSSSPFPPGGDFAQPGGPPAEPDFPPFPPGLIPGMVRKMQVGSGVPYSPISPLDIPTVIPPAAQTETYLISRLRNFYKEVGVGGDDLEVDAGPDVEERKTDRRFTDTKEMPMPTLNMEVNAETGALDDGSFYGGLGTGRAGLGAAEQTEENSDEFSSYRKARSTNYHMSIGVRTG